MFSSTLLAPFQLIFIFAGVTPLLASNANYVLYILNKKGSIVNYIPVFYIFVTVCMLRLIHFSVGYAYTLVVMDACREHVAKIAVRF